MMHPKLVTWKESRFTHGNEWTPCSPKFEPQTINGMSFEVRNTQGSAFSILVHRGDLVFIVDREIDRQIIEVPIRYCYAVEEIPFP